MAINIGINGFGRIGRYFTRMALQNKDINIIAINDLTDNHTLAHLFKYDSVHGQFNGTIKTENDSIFVNGHNIKMTAHKNPEEIPWGKMGVDIVIECTGVFRNREKASLHLKAGAKKVILSAPPSSDDIVSVVMGINENILTGKEDIISNASCTTNSAAPLVKVMKSLGEIESCFITTVHSYTSDQRLHDAPHSDLRRARAAAVSIVPTSTGAAKAISKIFPELKGKMGGCGVRVPVPNGSMTDMTFVMDRVLNVDDINKAFKKASETDLKNYIQYMEDPIVSVDIIGNPYSTIYDVELTSVIGRMVKVLAWYDNEAGYSNRLVDLVKYISK